MATHVRLDADGALWLDRPKRAALLLRLQFADGGSEKFYLGQQGKRARVVIE